MGGLETLTISRYLALSNKITDLKNYKQYKYWEFFQQSFNTSIVFDGYEVRPSSIKLETAVARLDRLLRMIDQRIEINEAKHRYWMKFFNELTKEEQAYFSQYSTLVQKNKRLDKLAIMEIKEIDEAIGYQFVNNSSEQGSEFERQTSNLLQETLLPF